MVVRRSVLALVLAVASMSLSGAHVARASHIGGCTVEVPGIEPRPLASARYPMSCSMSIFVPAAGSRTISLVGDRANPLQLVPATGTFRARLDGGETNYVDVLVPFVAGVPVGIASSTVDLVTGWYVLTVEAIAPSVAKCAGEIVFHYPLCVEVWAGVGSVTGVVSSP